MLAYDLTSVLFFEVICPISALGLNPDHHPRHQVNVGAVVIHNDRMFWRYILQRENRHGIGTKRNLLGELQRTSVRPGLLIVDQGLVGKATVEEVRMMGWYLLSWLSKHMKEVVETLATVKVPETPQSFVHATRTVAITRRRRWPGSGFPRGKWSSTRTPSGQWTITPSATRPSRSLARR